jgi:hypothetical protein
VQIIYRHLSVICNTSIACQCVMHIISWEGQGWKRVEIIITSYILHGVWASFYHAVISLPILPTLPYVCITARSTRHTVELTYTWDTDTRSVTRTF